MLSHSPANLDYLGVARSRVSFRLTSSAAGSDGTQVPRFTGVAIITSFQVLISGRKIHVYLLVQETRPEVREHPTFSAAPPSFEHGGAGRP
jgi:hypothetical protein